MIKDNPFQFKKGISLTESILIKTLNKWSEILQKFVSTFAQLLPSFENGFCCLLTLSLSFALGMKSAPSDPQQGQLHCSRRYRIQTYTVLFIPAAPTELYNLFHKSSHMHTHSYTCTHCTWSGPTTACVGKSTFFIFLVLLLCAMTLMCLYKGLARTLHRCYHTVPDACTEATFWLLHPLLYELISG